MNNPYEEEQQGAAPLYTSPSLPFSPLSAIPTRLNAPSSASRSSSLTSPLGQRSGPVEDPRDGGEA